MCYYVRLLFSSPYVSITSLRYTIYSYYKPHNIQIQHYQSLASIPENFTPHAIQLLQSRKLCRPHKTYRKRTNIPRCTTHHLIIIVPLCSQSLSVAPESRSHAVIQIQNKPSNLKNARFAVFVLIQKQCSHYTIVLLPSRCASSGPILSIRLDHLFWPVWSPAHSYHSELLFLLLF